MLVSKRLRDSSSLVVQHMEQFYTRCTQDENYTSPVTTPRIVMTSPIEALENSCFPILEILLSFFRSRDDVGYHRLH